MAHLASNPAIVGALGIGLVLLAGTIQAHPSLLGAVAQSPVTVTVALVSGDGRRTPLPARHLEGPAAVGVADQGTGTTGCASTRSSGSG